MNKAIKAALLSAFVCPGAGHFFLKKSKTAALFFAAFCFSFYFIIKAVLVKAQQIVDQMVSGQIPLDVASVSQNISEVMANSVHSLNVQMSLLLVIWALSIIDSYRLGKIALS